MVRFACEICVQCVYDVFNFVLTTLTYVNYLVDGIYVLVDKDFPIPGVLFDLVVRDETLCLLDGRWAAAGSPNKSGNLRKRFISRKLKDKRGSDGKRGAIYSLFGETGTDWVDCRVLHIYSCQPPKMEKSKKLPTQEKLVTAVCSPTEEKCSLDCNKPILPLPSRSLFTRMIRTSSMKRK
jgi:hypothetical protein